MNSDDGPFTFSPFDVKILNSKTLNYHTTPSASLSRDSSTTTSPAGRPLVHVSDYSLLSSLARSSAPPTPHGSHSPGFHVPHCVIPVPPLGTGDRFDRFPSPPRGSPRGRPAPCVPPDAGPAPHHQRSPPRVPGGLHGSTADLESLLRSSSSDLGLDSPSSAPGLPARSGFRWLWSAAEPTRLRRPGAAAVASRRPPPPAAPSSFSKRHATAGANAQ